jgi:hypothetical protein
MMTQRDIVILDTPAKKAAAPTMAKIPGEIPGTICPTSRPKSAPASREGIMTPDGTLQPNVMIVRMSLTRVPKMSQPM